MGMKISVIMEHRMGGPWKIKNVATCDPTNHLAYIFKGREVLKRHLLCHVHCYIIHKSRYTVKLIEKISHTHKHTHPYSSWNPILPFARMQMSLGDIILRETSKHRKTMLQDLLILLNLKMCFWGFSDGHLVVLITSEFLVWEFLSSRPWTLLIYKSPWKTWHRKAIPILYSLIWIHEGESFQG